MVTRCRRTVTFGGLVESSVSIDLVQQVLYMHMQFAFLFIFPTSYYKCMVHALIILSISRTCDLDIPYNFFHHLVAPSFEISVSRQRRIPAGFFNRDIMLHSTGVVNSNLCNRNHKISNLTVEHKGTHIIQCLPHNAVCSTACAMMWRQSVLSCLCILSK